MDTPVNLRTVRVNQVLMVRMIIGVLILLSTLSLIMVRPRRVTEAIAAAGGGALVLLGGYVGFSEALTLLRGACARVSDFR